jgi:hypothetical protein
VEIKSKFALGGVKTAVQNLPAAAANILLRIRLNQLSRISAKKMSTSLGKSFFFTFLNYSVLEIKYYIATHLLQCKKVISLALFLISRSGFAVNAKFTSVEIFHDRSLVAEMCTVF